MIPCGMYVLSYKISKKIEIYIQMPWLLKEKKSKKEAKEKCLNIHLLIVFQFRYTNT